MHKAAFLFVVCAALAGAVALHARTRRRVPRRAAFRRTELAEDCAVSECGADGMPLSAYAG